MNQADAKAKMRECRDKLKMALWHADSMITTPITPASMTSLWQLSGDAHAKINALKSEVCGNDAPKVGG